MGINKESDVSANLQIGPTTLGMVRLFIETETLELPLDFDPDEADEIAEELRAAAARAREAVAKAHRDGRPPEGESSGKGRSKGDRPQHGRGGSKRRAGSGSSR